MKVKCKDCERPYNHTPPGVGEGTPACPHCGGREYVAAPQNEEKPMQEDRSPRLLTEENRGGNLIG